MNDMLNDFQLLRAYADEGSDDAFRELVARHGGMVQGVALRAVGPNLADEVTQNTFLLLARKAKTMKANVVLAGWLHRAARFIAMETLRREKRKTRVPEELAIEEATATFDNLAPVLDDALERLKEEDRESIVLRFLEGRSFAEVGAAMRTSEAAAKMRVGRALEKLRAAFARQGIPLGVTALAAALSSQAAPAVPEGVAGVVLAKAAANSAGIRMGEVLRELLFMKKIKMAVIAGGALLFVGSVVAPMALSPKAAVNTFQPMAGEWTGTIQIDNGNGAKITQPVDLLVATSNGGRKAEITMKMGGGQVYNFTHEIDATGRRVRTSDDPKLSVLNGEGKVTHAQEGQQWAATVRTPHRSGYTDCEWTVHGDELKINRHDQQRKYYVHRFDQYSSMSLRRKIAASAGL